MLLNGIQTILKVIHKTDLCLKIVDQFQQCKQMYKMKTNKTQNIAQKTKTTMSNSEKLATLGTQDKGRIQTTQKTKTHPFIKRTSV
jgi:hypothetical protein